MHIQDEVHNQAYNQTRIDSFTIQNYHKKALISWGSVCAGMVTSLMIAMLLSMLFIGLGFSSFQVNPQYHSNIGLSIGLSSLLILVTSLFVGSFVAGRLAGKAGAIHGFLNWGSLTLLAFILSAFALNSALQLSSSMMSGAFVIPSNSLNENLAHNLPIKTVKNYRVSDNFLDKYLSYIHQKLDNKDYIDSYIAEDRAQLTNANNVIAKAVDDAKNSSHSNMEVADRLKADLDGVASRLADIIETKDITAKLVENNVDQSDASNKSPDIAKQLNLAREETRTTIFNAKNAMVSAISAGELTVKNSASNVMQEEANAAEHGILWTFFTSLIGAIASAIAGFAGCKTRYREYHSENVRTENVR